MGFEGRFWDFQLKSSCGITKQLKIIIFRIQWFHQRIIVVRLVYSWLPSRMSKAMVMMRVKIIH